MAVAHHHRHDKTPPAAFSATLDSFRLHLNAEGLPPKTIRLYADAAAWFAAEGLTHRKDFSGVTRADVNAWTVRLLDAYSATALLRSMRTKSTRTAGWLRRSPRGRGFTTSVTDALLRTTTGHRRASQRRPESDMQFMQQDIPMSSRVFA